MISLLLGEPVFLFVAFSAGYVMASDWEKYGKFLKSGWAKFTNLWK